MTKLNIKVTPKAVKLTKSSKIRNLLMLSNDNEEDEIKEEVNASSIQSTKENEDEIVYDKYPQIITTDALFNVNYNSRNKYTSEDLQDPDVQKKIASNGCIVFIQSLEKDDDSIALFCPKTYEKNSISSFKSFLPSLLHYPGCSKKDNIKYVPDLIKNMTNIIDEFNYKYYTGNVYVLSTCMISDVFVPERVRLNKNKKFCALEDILLRCKSLLPEVIWINKIVEKKKIMKCQETIMELFRIKATYNSNSSYSWNDSYCPYGLYNGETDNKYLIKGAKQGEVMEWKNELLKDEM